MNVYGRGKDTIEWKFLGINFNVGKLVNKFYQYAVKYNLFSKIGAIAANFLTAKIHATIEGAMKLHLSPRNMAFAEKYALRHQKEILKNFGNAYHKNEMLMFMQYNQISRTNDETYSRLDNKRLTRAFNQHFWWGGYSMGDFLVKGRTLMGLYHNYRLIETPSGKKFMTENEYIQMKGVKRSRAVLDEFYSNVGLHEAYDIIDGTLKVRPEYKKYVTTKLENDF